MSNHTCNLDIPELTDEVIEGNIVPDLNASLVSSRKLCDARYNVEYTKYECIVYQNKLLLKGDMVHKKGTVVLKVKRDRINGLWTLPIRPRGNHKTRHTRNTTYTTEEIQHSAAKTIYTLPYKKQRMKYMHQSFFNLLDSMLMKSIENKKLKNFPYMKSDMIRKYLPPSPATPKG